MRTPLAAIASAVIAIISLGADSSAGDDLVCADPALRGEAGGSPVTIDGKLDEPRGRRRRP